MSDYDVIVIGAGCGGLTAGALLAKQGRSVLVLEQSGLVGGCCSTFEKDGYHFDVGATLLELVEPIEQVFGMLGTTLADEVDLVTVDPAYNVVLEDGSRFHPHSHWKVPERPYHDCLPRMERAGGVSRPSSRSSSTRRWAASS